MDAIAGQGIQEDRQGSYQGLTFTCCHLGNLSLMENHATEELYVVVDHLPFQVVATSSPVIVIDGLVTIDGDEVLAGIGCQLTVEVCSRDDGLLILGEAACSLLNDGKHLEHHLVESLLIDIEHFLLYFVDFCKDVGTLIDGRALNLCLQFGYLCLLLLGRRLYLLLQLLCTGTQGVIVECFDLGRYLLYLLHKGLNQFHIARRFVAEQGLENLVEIHILDYFLFFLLTLFINGCKVTNKIRNHQSSHHKSVKIRFIYIICGSEQWFGGACIRRPDTDRLRKSRSNAVCGNRCLDAFGLDACTVENNGKLGERGA